ncbi:MAG: Rne/Rng family ribonuclease [Candidatus Latescibacterota bacterium]|nr:MAG: Rne/Rng family ribonuclease [Candidatus Latescibacterota bacterium]
MARDKSIYSEIIVNASPNETRVAILENHLLVEFLAERADAARQVGDIFKGRVNAVLPGMQAAFVEIGLEKTAFLHVSDMVMPDAESMETFAEAGDRPEPPARKVPRGVSIEGLLKKGQEIMVQVTKEPIGTKGPRVTTQISLAGRYLVLMPRMPQVGVSRKIENREDRARLRETVHGVLPAGMGAIVRTVAEGKQKRHFVSDIRYLTGVWKKIEEANERMPCPSLLHKEVGLTTGLIRDLFTEDVDRLILDSRREHKQVLTYLQSTSPELRSRVHLYKEDTPIFDAYEIENEIQKTLSSKIWLKAGGYIVIEQAEALVAIDVNTGRYTGEKDQEETIVRTNLEAAREIPRQLRLRDVGGIIVIDFIDMEKESNREKVLETLRDALKRDRSRTKTFRVSELGLVEMTRQRVRPSLLHYFSSPCPHCGGTGKRLSLATLAMKVERLLRRVSSYCDEKKVVVKLNPEVAVTFLEGGAGRLEEIEKRYRLSVEVQDDPSLGREEIRVFGRRSGKELTDQVVF